MSGVFDKLKSFQINLGDFERQYKEKNEVAIEKVYKVGIPEKLGINPLLLENLTNNERVIYSIGIHLMNKMNKFIGDSTDIHRNMSISIKNMPKIEYEELSKIGDGIINNSETAFNCISNIYKMFIRKDKDMLFKYTESELLVMIRGSKDINKDIMIRFLANENDNRLTVVKEKLS